jgi:hypothetical protein
MSWRILRLVLVVATLWALPGFAQKQELGARLPDGATQVGKHRFRVHMSMEALLKFYDRLYPSSAYPRTHIVNQPNVQALHIRNPQKGNWAGINIYETKGEGAELRIFVVPAEKPPAAPAKRPARPSK